MEKYRNAVRAYYEAVFGLSCVPGSEFNQAWQVADGARKNSDSARAALLAHEHDHACLLPVAAGQIPGFATEDFILGDQGQSGG